MHFKQHNIMNTTKKIASALISVFDQTGLEPSVRALHQNNVTMYSTFWAFAWAGGQALARWLLDHPHQVAGRSVLDFAAGSGLVGIAAMQAGAARVLCADIDPFCGAAVGLNAAANSVVADFTDRNLLDAPPPAVDVICAGDVCYERPMADRVLDWLHQAKAAGTRVLIGDPGRTYFPREGLTFLAEYRVPTTRELEDQEIKRSAVWAL